MKKATITLKDNVEKILDSKKLWYFVKWYLQGCKEDEWEQVQKVMCIDRDSKWAIDNYLKREDVQRAMIEVTKLNKDFNLVQIYNKMLEKSLDGDVNSANWIVKFSESDFFEQKKNALDDLIGGLNIDD